MEGGGLTDGAWTGRRVFVLGGGPSLRDVDISSLAGETTLGLNWAFVHNPTAALVYDKRLMDAVGQSPAWRGYGGAKFWLNSEAPQMPDDVLYHGARQLRAARPDPAYPKWPRRLSDGLYRGNNAGSAGICLADVLGASAIYLLGFDLRLGDAGPNWHDLYPEQWRAKQAQLDSYRKDLDKVSWWVRGKVFNLTPGSALLAFPQATLAEVLARPMSGSTA